MGSRSWDGESSGSDGVGTGIGCRQPSRTFHGPAGCLIRLSVVKVRRFGNGRGVQGPKVDLCRDGRGVRDSRVDPTLEPWAR